MLKFQNVFIRHQLARKIYLQQIAHKERFPIIERKLGLLST